ncbi:MAG TPA: hypothetical protein VFO85_13950 [Vicinamibacteria bacterium]|nr:hypothetical protein [Vicinamibacteria bacterium]
MAGARDGRRRRAQTQAAQEARRRDGRHCPVCLAVLPRMAGGAARRCAQCGARPAAGLRCSRCHQEAVWQAERGAACASCGHHGSRVRVIAGHEWLEDDDDGTP